MRVTSTAGLCWLISALLLAPLTASGRDSDAADCAAQARRAKVPEALIGALYLNEWNSPAELMGIPCAAAKTGAKFRYNRSGLFGTDSFSISAKDSVRVWVKPVKQGDGTTVVLIPVEYEKNGEVFTVTRSNIQQLSFYIRQALANE